MWHLDMSYITSPPSVTNNTTKSMSHPHGTSPWTPTRPDVVSHKQQGHKRLNNGAESRCTWLSDEGVLRRDSQSSLGQSLIAAWTKRQVASPWGVAGLKILANRVSLSFNYCICSPRCEWTCSDDKVWHNRRRREQDVGEVRLCSKVHHQPTVQLKQWDKHRFSCC